MIIRSEKSQTTRSSTSMRRFSLYLFLSLVSSTMAFADPALATFITFTGDATAELDWRNNAGNTGLEDFESFPVGTQVTTLPALGIGFSELDGGGFPQIYRHVVDTTPYGRNHLGNFPNGINNINRFDDIVLNTLAGWTLTALGFWNGDGQADTFFASVYDSSNNLLGSVGAFKGTFAGFVTDTPVSRVVFDGNTGDGWNHLDGLQTNAVAVPSPYPSQMILIGLLFLLAIRRGSFLLKNS